MDGPKDCRRKTYAPSSAKILPFLLDHDEIKDVHICGERHEVKLLTFVCHAVAH